MNKCKLCDLPAKARNLCQKHYDRQRRTGSAMTPDCVKQVWNLDDTKKHLFYNAKRLAKQKGIPFALTASDIEVPNVCPVLGMVLERGTKNFVDSSPSLDRVRPELGYVPGNVRVISWRANRIKNDSSVEELERILEYARGRVV